ncbi:hypothetical protein HanRHA438_Chr09g0388111 [Helianthus annuus]|nr:hypothetical protein HanRHA438_Chr09g0388111 [Helianthus annuus]
MKTSLVTLLLVLLCLLLLLLILSYRPWAPTIPGLMTHLETPLTTTLVALATVVSVTIVAPWVISLIPSLPVTTRRLLTGTLVVVSPSLLNLRLNCS